MTVVLVLVVVSTLNEVSCAVELDHSDILLVHRVSRDPFFQCATELLIFHAAVLGVQLWEMHQCLRRLVWIPVWTVEGHNRCRPFEVSICNARRFKLGRRDNKRWKLPQNVLENFFNVDWHIQFFPFFMVSYKLFAILLVGVTTVWIRCKTIDLRRLPVTIKWTSWPAILSTAFLGKFLYMKISPSTFLKYLICLPVVYLVPGHLE